MKRKIDPCFGCDYYHPDIGCFCPSIDLAEACPYFYEDDDDLIDEGAVITYG